MDTTGWLLIAGLVSIGGQYYDKNRKHDMIVPIIAVFLIAFFITAIDSASPKLAQTLTAVFVVSVFLIYLAPVLENLYKGHGSMGPVTHHYGGSMGPTGKAI